MTQERKKRKYANLLSLPDQDEDLDINKRTQASICVGKCPVYAGFSHDDVDEPQRKIPKLDIKEQDLADSIPPDSIYVTEVDNARDILQNFFRRNFVTLKDELEPKLVANRLFQSGVISLRDLEDVRESPKRALRCDIMIKAIIKSPETRKSSSVALVKNAFEKEQYGHLVKDILSSENTTGPIKKIDKNTFYLDLDGLCIIPNLSVHSSLLIEEIDPKRFIDDLVVTGVLSFDDHTYLRDANNRTDAVRSLIQIVSDSYEEKFHLFWKQLNKHYPEIGAKIIKSPTDAKGAELKFIPTFKFNNSTWKTKVSDALTSTEVKFKFSGNSDYVEKMIVDQYTATPNESLIEEAMEVAGMDVSNVSFSSIRINLLSLSCQSQLRFLQACKENPSYIIKWLKLMMSKQSLKRLAKSGANTVFFEIEVNRPVWTKENGRRQEISVAKQLAHCIGNKRCKLKKEDIVKHFTFVEKELQHVDEIIKPFTECTAFSKKTRNQFSEVFRTENELLRKQRFLMKVLNCDQPIRGQFDDCSIYLCLLEKMMRETGQRLILKKLLVKEQPISAKRGQITPHEVQNNMDYLIDELEPKMFLHELASLPRSETIVDVIVSEPVRRRRCEQFLEFIINEGQPAIEWFNKALKSNGMQSVIDVIHIDDEVDFTESIIDHYEKIVEEVEPNALRQTFVGRHEISAKQIDELLIYPTRRQRIVWFLKHIVNNHKTSTHKCFVDALELAGYDLLANSIREEKGENNRQCTRLAYLCEAENVVKITGTFDMHVISTSMSWQFDAWTKVKRLPISVSNTDVSSHDGENGKSSRVPLKSRSNGTQTI